MDAERPLTERFTLPVPSPRHVRAVCDPTAPLTPADQSRLHEDLSSVQGGAIFESVARRMRQGGIILDDIDSALLDDETVDRLLGAMNWPMGICFPEAIRVGERTSVVVELQL